jgi:hypothetical protein
MKLIFVTSLLVILGINANAQYLDFNGFTIQATTILYIEDGEPNSVNTDQVFIVSFSDKFLTHLIYSDGSIDISQIYQMENNTSFIKEGNTIYKFDAISGTSGLRYYYEIKIGSDGRLSSLKLTQPNEEDFTIFKGGISKLNTFKQ